MGLPVLPDLRSKSRQLCCLPCLIVQTLSKIDFDTIHYSADPPALVTLHAYYLSSTREHASLL